MKLPRRFKIFFLITLLLLYVTGVIYFIFDRFVKVDGAWGVENHPWQLPTLHVHAIVGLVFFVVFGYLFRAHVEPAWRDRKKRRRVSGGSFVASMALLGLTVPILYYATNEMLKMGTAILHTYVGLLIPALFVWHYFRSSK